MAFAGVGNLVSAGPAGLVRWPLAVPAPDELVVGRREQVLPDRLWYLDSSPAGVLALAGLGEVKFLAPGMTPVLVRHGSDMRGITVSPDSRLAAGTLPAGPAIRIWETASGTMTQTLPVESPGRCVFAPDSHRLAFNGQDSVVVWDLTTGRELWRRTLPRPMGALAWSPDRRIVAAGRKASTIHLLDAATGASLAVLEHAFPRSYPSLVFSPDSSQLAAVSGSHRIHLWDFRALRGELQRMGLDWDQPGPGPDRRGPPVRITVAGTAERKSL